MLTFSSKEPTKSKYSSPVRNRSWMDWATMRSVLMKSKSSLLRSSQRVLPPSTPLRPQYRLWAAWWRQSIGPISWV
jgi:hypothetical protein